MNKISFTKAVVVWLRDNGVFVKREKEYKDGRPVMVNYVSFYDHLADKFLKTRLTVIGNFHYKPRGIIYLEVEEEGEVWHTGDHIDMWLYMSMITELDNLAESGKQPWYFFNLKRLKQNALSQRTKENSNQSQKGKGENKRLQYPSRIIKHPGRTGDSGAHVSGGYRDTGNNWG